MKSNDFLLHNFQLTNGTKFREFPAPAMIELKE
jgi:hypothetical protein